MRAGFKNSIVIERTTKAKLGVSASADGHYLAARRLVLQLATSIERGTRWVLTAPNTPPTWERAGHQVEEFLEQLLPHGGSWPKRHSVLIIDNASFHRGERIQ